MSWIDVNHDLPINDLDEFEGNVVGVVYREGLVGVEFVHFDGDSWYDENSKACRVTHWMPTSIDCLVGVAK